MVLMVRKLHISYKTYVPGYGVAEINCYSCFVKPAFFQFDIHTLIT